jgi:RNA polymerase sigma-70 factor (sigma-E family)
MMSVPSTTIDLLFEEAFEDLFTRAYGVAYQLLGRRSEAEDVAQETLARAFVRWRKIRPYAEAWVVRVAGNLAIDTWRRLRRIDTDAATERRGATAPGPDGQRVDLHRALGQLPRRQREVVILRFLADLPEADVAKALGCSVGSVKQHASRGLAALRTTMAVDDAADTQEH